MIVRQWMGYLLCIHQVVNLKLQKILLHTIKGGMGQKVLKYYQLRSRHSVIRGWIELAELNNDRVYVEAFNIGTPTSRQRHSKVVNVPNSNAFFGIRNEIFIYC